MSDPQYPATPPTGPTPGATPGPTPGAMPAPVGQWQAPGDPAVAAAPAADGGSPAPKRSRKALLAIGGAVVVLGAGAFASAQLLGDEAGAESPEAAGRALLDAIGDEDVIGVIDLLPEGERQLLLDITEELQATGDEFGLLDDSFTLDGFPGLTLDIEEAELEVDEVGDGIANVTVVDGTATVEVDGDELVGNLGDVLDEIVEENDGEVEADDVEEQVDIGDLVAEAEEEAEERGGPVLNPFMVTVVEEDGRWFPSVAFTIAEFARIDADRFGDGPDAPDLDDGIEPEGADSPEAVIQELLDAATGADAEAAVALLDPGELSALQVYADVVFGELDAGEATELDAELTDADVTSLGGGVNRVVPTGFVVEGEVDGGDVSIVLDDGCVTVEAEATDPDEEDVDLEVCGGDDLADTLPDELGDALDDVEVPEELSELLEAFQPIELGVITVERDGEHFVSPIRTAFDLLAVSFRGLERDDLEEGGIVFELLTGGLDDEFEDFFAELEERFEDEIDVDIDDPIDDPIDEPAPTPRDPTGATGSGPGGELLAGDVVEGSFVEGETATFVVVGTAGDAFIGAQSLDGGDLTITLTDIATGEELDFNDDFVSLDPEAFAVLEEGQAVLVTVADFGSNDPGQFVVYYEN